MTPKEAKNYVAGTLERDQPYERLLRQVVLDGELTHDRTGVGTLSTFGTRMEFNLQDGFPLVTTKKVFLRGIIAELLWFIAGDNKVSTLQKQNVHIWDEWVLPDGTIGKGYPIQWRSWPKTDGTTVDQLSNALDLIKHNPNSRRIIVSAWIRGRIGRNGITAMPRPVPIPRAWRRFSGLPTVSAVGGHVLGRTVQHRLLLVADHDDGPTGRIGAGTVHLGRRRHARVFEPSGTSVRTIVARATPVAAYGNRQGG